MMMSAREAVENDYKALAEAFYRGDADTISRMYTENAELFVPGAPIIEGRQAILDAWKTIVGSGGDTVSIDVREVQESGDWAYDTGRFTARAPDGSILNVGKWIVIWNRQPSGEWRIHRDFMHWDIPPIAPVAP
jgi:ketosteroid isomerase-like protein